MTERDIIKRVQRDVINLKREDGVEYSVLTLDDALVLALELVKNNVVLADVSESFDSKEAIAEAKEIWSTGKRLKPIRMVQFATGMDLKQAKEYCEANFR